MTYRCHLSTTTHTSGLSRRHLSQQRCRAAVAAPSSPVPKQRSLQSPSKQNTDIVVIGSGIGGLSCASLLAKYGYKVGPAHMLTPFVSHGQTWRDHRPTKVL